MNSILGHAGVALGFLAAVTGSITMLYGLRKGRVALTRQGRAYAWLMLGGVVLAVAAMENALITHDFSVAFVAQNSNRETSLLFLIAGMWSALEGSILLWSLVLTLYIAAMTWHFRARRDDSMVVWASVVAFVVAAFFFGLMLGPADPFTSVSGAVPLNGTGANPLLANHPLMAFHPPILYAGYVGFTIPFAFGMASLITGRVGEGWLLQVRQWTLVAWGLLGTGILLGSWWSYEVLGWGGYWAWDPVENASLLPWLTATAYLHSVMVQERRGMLRVWNLSLLSATFSLTILGTFFTRSGVLDSVHAFTESPLGPWLLTAFGVVVVATCALVFWRSDRLSSPGSIGSPLAREAAFLANNIVFAALAFVVLLGTVFPLLAEAINGQRLTVGRPFFDTMTRPLGISLLFLMAVSPLLQWRGGTLDTLKDRLQWSFAVATVAVVLCVVSGVRGPWVVVGLFLATLVVATSVRQIVLLVQRQGAGGLVGRSSGAMIAHAGLAIIAIGIIASQSYSTRSELQLQPGESAVVAGHRITFEGLREEKHRTHDATVADVKIDNGKSYAPALNVYPNAAQAIGTPSVRAGFSEDVYLTLVRTPVNDGDATVLSVIVQPLVSWIWFGGFVIALGTAIAIVPRRTKVIDVTAATIEREAVDA